MIGITSGELETGIREFYLNGLDYWDDYDMVVGQLCQNGAKFIDKFDGIYSRNAIVDMNNIVFKIIYHEDVGMYSFLESDQSNTNNEILSQVLSNLIDQIKKKL